MSRLDLLMQMNPRLVDAAASRIPSSNAESKEGGTGEGKGFDVLLQGLSNDIKSGAAQEERLLSSLLDETDLKGADGESGLSDAGALAGPQGATDPQSGSAVYTLLENLLPRILEQASPGKGTATDRNGRSLLPSSLAMSQDDADGSALMNPALGSKLAVSVQGQETHFRPVVENFETVLTEAAEPMVEAKPGQAPKDVSSQTPKDDAPLIDPSTLAEAAPAEEGDAFALARNAGERNAGGGLAERHADRIEMQKNAPNGVKGEGHTLPSSTLHQLAGAILKDVKLAAQNHAPSFHGDMMNRVTVARASAGVLRVLNLQLNPAELGVVTIRMRLAGDGLEMELHAEREETAELLRNDADKLSGLLKASGYRPDMITIQSTEASTNDRQSFQRSSQGQPSQGQDFQQGGAAGQGGSSQHRSEHHGRDAAHPRRDAPDDRSAGGGLSSGIYL